MSLFNKPRIHDPFAGKIKSPIPLEHIDIKKRYDIYCYVSREIQLYENVKFVAVRTLEDISPHFSNIGGLIEIESIDGNRVMIPKFHVHMICEHGMKPKYKVLATLSESQGNGNRGPTL